MREITKKYTNGEVTVVWKPSMCIHSAICFKGLPEVFDPRRRPWITPEASNTDAIIVQIKQCPSGALSYFMNEEKKNEEVR
ncbi:(4Fe-4S)-binding protein [soil metagenome]